MAGIIATYEGRLRAMQSENDKLRAALNSAVGEQTRLQNESAQEQLAHQTALTNAATAAQAALDRAAKLETDYKIAQAQAAKSQALLERPHLAGYAQLIPATTDTEALKSTLDTLEQIRNRDLEAARAGAPPSVLPGVGLPTPTPQTLPNPAQGQPPSLAAQQLAYAQQLYGNRPTMAPMFAIPPSQPATMHPTGGADPTQTIASNLAKARAQALASGDMSILERAIEEQKTLLPVALGNPD